MAFEVLDGSFNGAVAVGVPDVGILNSSAVVGCAASSDLSGNIVGRVLLVVLNDDPVIAEADSVKVLANLVNDPGLCATLLLDGVSPDTPARALLHDKDGEAGVGCGRILLAVIGSDVLDVFREVAVVQSAPGNIVVGVSAAESEGSLVLGLASDAVRAPWS